MSLFALENVRCPGIIDIPSLEIEEGITVVRGESGSGKTTFLRLLAHMQSPPQGRIFFHGEDLEHLDPVLYRRRVVMLPQNPPVFPGTVGENITAGVYYAEKALPEAKEIAHIMERMYLRQEGNENAQQLSGGEKQRLALGRVLLLHPEVLLLDEPTSHLDEGTEDEVVWTLVDDVRRWGSSLIMVTHSGNVADNHADRLVVISGGKVTRA